MLSIDTAILKNYREKLIQVFPDYSHMIKFEICDTSSHYYIDSNDKFWLPKTLLDKFQFSAELRVQKYLDIDGSNQALFIKFEDSSEEFLQTLVDKDTATQFPQQPAVLDTLRIIFSNKRWGAPRKNIAIDKQIYNIQFPEDKQEDKPQTILSPEIGDKAQLHEI